jgi:beta-lactamase superfamily II metal-dependent hydrolase
MQMELEKKATLTNPVDFIVSNFPERDIFRFILTHPDMDHMSGIKSLFTKKDVWNFWDVPNNKPDPGNWDQSPYDKDDWDFYQNLKTRKISNITIVKPLRDQISKCCWVQDSIRILSPNKELIKKAEESGDYDNLSYVLMIEYASRKVLLGGDATKFAWQSIVEYYGDYLESDVLLAPGHGSANHISAEILDLIKPRLTIVSVAEGVDYDYHTYKNYGRVLSTKHYGNIRVRIRTDGEIVFTTRFQNYRDGWYVLKDKSFYYGW